MDLSESEKEKKQVKQQVAKEKKEKPNVKIWQAGIGGIALIVYIIWLGNKTFGPPAQYENDKTRANTALTARVSPQAGPTGDLTKVNPKDREEFLAMLRGAPINPRTVLVNYWKGTHKSTGEVVHGWFQTLHWFP